MSIVSTTPENTTVIHNEQEQALFDNWAAEVREFHAKHATPIHEGDPRATELAAFSGSDRNDQLTADELGELHFNLCTPEGFPAWPLPVPAWVNETKITNMVYPEIVVTFRGRQHSARGFTAAIETGIVSFVEDAKEWHDEETTPRGEVHYTQTQPLVFIGDYQTDMNAEDALALAGVIAAAANELQEAI